VRRHQLLTTASRLYRPKSFGKLGIASDAPYGLPPGEAEKVAKAYLIDAAMSLAGGRGPLVV
jgi:hypothetical protein